MALDAGSVYATLGGKFNPSGFVQFDGAMKRSTGHAGTFERALAGSTARAGRAMKLLAVGGVAGVTVGIAGAVKKAADFEAQLSSLQAVSNANAGAMAKLKQQALQAGAATKYSALQAAQAQTELAKGGLSVQQILGGGLKGALALAAAGELDLADAATYTANALNLFQLNGDQATHVADALAQAANATTADVGDFGMALTQGGSAAKAAGLSFDETVAALEALASAGIKGSDAGTSLKAALTQLASPTKKAQGVMDELGLSFFDAHGDMKPLVDISAMLQDRMKGLTREQRLQAATTLVGTDGMRALLSLYDAGPTKVKGFEDGLAKQGTAAEVAAKKQDNLKGKIENLKGSVETAAIALGEELLPYLEQGAEKVTDFINSAAASGDISAFGKDIVGAMKAVVDVAGQGEAAIATFIGEWQNGVGIGGQVRDVFTQVAGAAANAAPTIEGLASAGASALGIILPLALGVAQFAASILNSQAGVALLVGVVGALTGRMAALAVLWAVGQIQSFASSVQSAATELRVAGATASTTASGLRAYGAGAGEAAVGVGAVRAASLGAAAGIKTLSAAAVTNIFTGLIAVAGLAAGALGLFGGSEKQASVSTQELNDQLDRQADALRQVRDSDLDVAARRANLKSATVGVEQAEKRLHDTRKSDKSTALDVKQAEADLAQARVNQKRATRDLGDATEDNSKKQRTANQTTRDSVKDIDTKISAYEKEAKSLKDKLFVESHTGAGKSSAYAAQLRKELEGVNAQLARLKDKKVKVEGNTADAEKEIARLSDRLLRVANAKTVAKILASSGSSEEIIARLKARLASIHNKDVYITTHERTVGSGSTGRGTGAGSKGHVTPKAVAPSTGSPTGIGGGLTTSGPMLALLGDGDTRYPEFAIPTEPRYRGRGVDLWLQAAQALGIPGFKAGVRKGPAPKKKPRYIPPPLDPLRLPVDAIEHASDVAKGAFDKQDSKVKGIESDIKSDTKTATQKKTKYNGKERAQAQNRVVKEKVALKKAQAARTKLKAIWKQRHDEALQARDYQSKIDEQQQLVDIYRGQMDNADKKDDQKAFDTAKGKRTTALDKLRTLIADAQKHAKTGSSYFNDLEQQITGIIGDQLDNDAAVNTVDQADPAALSDKDQAQLNAIEKAIALDEVAGNVDQEKTDVGGLERFWQEILSARISSRAPDTAITAAAEAVKSAHDTLVGLNDGGAGGGPDADLQAQLDQANQRTAVEANRARLSEAALGVFGPAGSSGDGSGGAQTVHNYNFQSIVPPTRQQIEDLGRMATDGQGSQGFRSAGRGRLPL